MTSDHAALEAARELRPLLQEHRAAADAQARMAPEVYRAMGAAGMFRLIAPVEVGGLEAPLSAMAAVCEELAVGDPGAAWHLANSPMAGLLAGSLDVETRERVFADPGACYSYSAMPAGVARRVPGGYELTGRWPFVTGIRDSSWAVLAGTIHEGEGPPKLSDLRSFLVRAEQLVIEDTWSRAAAMRSSGSHAVRAESVFVEDRLVYSFRQPRIIDRSMYRLSPAIVFTVGASSIALGVLRGAIEATIATASKKTSSWDGSAWADHVTVRQAVARAAATHHCCRAGLFAALDDLQRRYEHTATIAPEERAITWATLLHVADQARVTASTLAGPATSQAFISGHPFEAAVRDIHAIPVSLEHMRPLEEAAGAVLLGAPAGTPLF